MHGGKSPSGICLTGPLISMGSLRVTPAFQKLGTAEARFRLVLGAFFEGETHSGDVLLSAAVTANDPDPLPDAGLMPVMEPPGSIV